MTFIRAMTEIENALTALQIKDKFGEPCPGDQCMGYLEKFSGGRWGKMLDEFEAGLLTVEDFLSEALTYVDQIGRARFRKVLIKRLIDLDTGGAA